MEILTALYVKLGVLALVAVRATLQKSLTPAGIAAAVGVGLVHAVHPWSIFFVLLVSFFVAGTAVTKVCVLPGISRPAPCSHAHQVKHAHKASLTTSASGNVANAPHPRTATQVLCNSLPATLAIAVHALFLQIKMELAPTFLLTSGFDTCLPRPNPTATSTGPPSIATALPYAILAFYAAVTADTFASELGILSSGEPWLITTLPLLFGLKAPARVPRGTNGGVSLAGTAASALGAALVAAVAVLFTPFCKGSNERQELRTAYAHNYQALAAKDQHLRQWTPAQTVALAGGIALAGVAGALLDSLLGAWFQASVVDVPTGKVVEGVGGGRVRVKAGGEGSRKVVVGRDRLSNNAVNLVMGALTALAVEVGVAVYMGTGVASFVGEWVTLGKTGATVYRILASREGERSEL